MCADVYTHLWRGAYSHMYVQVSRVCVQMCIHVFGGVRIHISMFKWAECVWDVYAHVWRGVHSHKYVQVSRVCVQMCIHMCGGVVHSHIYVQVYGACVQMCMYICRGVRTSISIFRWAEHVYMCIHVCGGVWIHTYMLRWAGRVCIHVHTCVEGCTFTYLCSGERSVDADVYTRIWRPMVAVRSLLWELSTLFTEAGSLSLARPHEFSYSS